MAQQPGTRLGPYELLDLIGSGGMGEVYRARDTRLDRTVAVKLLPEALSADPERRARFEREAHTVAQLSHPNICTLHDIGSKSGIVYLVMEHLAGETLASRLTRGALPLPAVLDVAAQIADALGAAHRSHIVHRDLKPANVMLTPTGVKLLDFGLAKLKIGDGVPAVAVGSGSQTHLAASTAGGTIVGTLPYMAPEQVQGQEADARTDLWALGAMLYEMVTGARAFDAPSAVGLVGAILEREPRSIGELQPQAPPALVRLVTRCLRKNPDDRWESARDVANELRWIASSAETERPRPPALRRWALPLAATAGVGVGALVLRALTAAPALAPASAPAQVVRSAIELPAELPIATASGPSNVGRPSMAISPDGAAIVYVGQRGSGTQLFLRKLAEPEPAPVQGTEGAYNPFFSPDGEWIGFFAAGRLKKTSVRSGDPVVLCEVRNPLGATWLADGTIVIGDQEATVLTRVPSDGTGAAAERWQGVVRGGASWPQALPDGQHVLARDRDGNTVVVSLATAQKHILVPDATGATYLRSGHLVFVRGGLLMAAPFDLQSLQLTAPAVPVVPDVRTEASSQAVQVSVSSNGILAYVKGGPGITQLTWVDRQGRAESVAVAPRAFGTFALSPDGRRVAMQVNSQGSDVWIVDLARNAFMRLTTDGVSRMPVWTPDGARVAFYAARPDAPGLYWQPWDGSARAERVFEGGSGGDWSPDGRAFLYTRPSAHGSLDLWIFRLGGGASAHAPFLETDFTEWGPAWSPDGRWVAYTSDESGRYEVYVRSAGTRGGKWQVSTDGGEEPRWSGDGRELFFRNGQQWLVAAATADAATFAVAQPAALFSGAYVNPPGPSYDIAEGGRRFLVLAPAGAAEDLRQVHLVQNWFAELSLKAPVAVRR